MKRTYVTVLLFAFEESTLDVGFRQIAVRNLRPLGSHVRAWDGERVWEGVEAEIQVCRCWFAVWSKL